MLLKKLIVFINITYYFIVVQSVDVYVYVDEHNLESTYWKEIFQNRKNIKDDYSICRNDAENHDSRISLVATICKSTMDTLRTMNQNYNDELYIAYNFFSSEILKREGLCKSRNLTIVTSENPVLQKMIPCFNKPAFIEGKSHSFKINTTIHIYPTNESFTSWLVFNCTTSYCTLKTWLIINDIWTNLVPTELFGLVMPVFHSDPIYIYIYLFDYIKKWDHLMKSITHVLHEVDSHFFRILCSKITEKAALNIEIEKPQLRYSDLIFSIPKTNNEYENLNGYFYSCDNFIEADGFSLFIGYGDFTVILGKREFDHSHMYYRIIKIVSHIYTDYLNYIL